MKKLLVALFLTASILPLIADEPSKPATVAEEVALAKKAYAEFLGQVVKRENVVDLVAVMDRLIDEGEHGLVDKQPDPGLVEATTKVGLRIEFSTTDAKQAIIYYLKISRNGSELHYDDATKFAALFTDRAGLPHPFELSEGDNFVFTARWLIKPSEWKKFLKLMNKTRAENRAEKDLSRAFIAAVQNEVVARSTAQGGH